MSHPQNDVLMDQAYQMASSKFDGTAPVEIIMEEAKQIYEQLLEKEPTEPEDWDLVNTGGLCGDDEDNGEEENE